MKTFWKLLLLVAVVGALAGIAVPIINYRGTDCGQSAEMSNIRQIALCILTFVQINGEFPESAQDAMTTLGLSEIEFEQMAASPAFTYKAPTLPIEQLTGIEGQTPLMIYYHTEGAWVGFLDAHVTWYTFEELRNDESLREFIRIER